MPYVLRLAGTDDEPSIEVARYEFIAVQVTRRIISLLCEKLFNRTDLAALRDASPDKNGIEQALTPIFYSLGDFKMKQLINQAYMLLRWESYSVHPRIILNHARNLAPNLSREIFTTATEILDEAIKLGKHQVIDDIPLANQRLENAFA